jgi:isochorismate synthase EntC
MNDLGTNILGNTEAQPTTVATAKASAPTPVIGGSPNDQSQSILPQAAV